MVGEPPANSFLLLYLLGFPARRERLGGCQPARPGCDGRRGHRGPQTHSGEGSTRARVPTDGHLSGGSLRGWMQGALGALFGLARSLLLDPGPTSGETRGRQGPAIPRPPVDPGPRPDPETDPWAAPKQVLGSSASLASAAADGWAAPLWKPRVSPGQGWSAPGPLPDGH